MTTVPEAFDKFRRRLEITKTEQDDAARRQKEVRECINNDFDIKRDFLTGSYARHTKTKPLKDVDIFFVLGEEEQQRRKDPPGKTIDAFEDCLVGKYGRENVERGRRCVTVEFEKRNPGPDEESKVLSIDAVPAFEKGSHYELPDDFEGLWIASDPEVHKDQATAKNKELGGNWVPLVKMAKAWNREHGKVIRPSFLVEVMAQDLVDGPFNNYQDEVRRFFAAAEASIGDEWPDPAGLGPPVSDQMDFGRVERAKEALRDAEIKATRAFREEQNGRQAEAIRLWREILGQYFPAR